MEGILHLTQGPPRRRFNCPDEATLAAHIDGGIEPARRSRIEAHVSNCRYCLAQVGFALRLQNEELPPVPQALLRRLHENGASARRRPWPGWQWAAASVVAGCALLAGLLVSRKTETPPVQVAAAQQPAIPNPIIPAAPARSTIDTNEQLERRERTRTMPA